MSSILEELREKLDRAKQQLPLPDLMERLGLGDRVRKSAKCPLHKDRENSFSVYERGGEHLWNCFASCGGGDGAKLLAKLENLSYADACRRYTELAGTAGTGSSHRTKRVASSATRVAFPVMPDAVAAAWIEGVEFLLANPAEATRLAIRRGWPGEFAQYLIDCAAISAPLCYGERAMAFQVVAPQGERGSMRRRPIGYHVRTKAPDGSPTWRYLPNERQHGYSIASLPYIIGSFEDAELLIIVEGQWDALTFALAAGWLGDGCFWPAKTGVLGIRGAQGWRPFLEYYRQFWPRNANCLVLADADRAGSGWYEGEQTFVSELAKLRAKVAVVDCAPHKDFNDLFRAEKPGPAEIAQLLASHDMSLESGVLS